MVVDYAKKNQIHPFEEEFMTYEMVSISKFKATCLALLDKVKRIGKPLFVTCRGEPIALITPPPEPEKPSSWLGSFESSGKLVGDIISPALDESD